MGFSLASISHYIELGRAGKLRRGGRILDLGSQNVSGDIPLNVGREFMQTFGVTVHDDRIAQDLRPGVKVEHLMRDAGFQYSAFDVYVDGATRIFDLNTQSLEAADVARFDVVTNYGTSEHVCNQFNLFKVAHDALSIGGVMINSVPFYGHVNHGLFNYHPKFFTSLINNNGYETFFIGFSDVYRAGDTDSYADTEGAENGEHWKNKYLGSAEIIVIFRKVTDAPFKSPTDTGEYATIQSIYPSQTRARRMVEVNQRKAGWLWRLTGIFH
jgi:hypothetical protein